MPCPHPPPSLHLHRPRLRLSQLGAHCSVRRDLCILQGCIHPKVEQKYLLSTSHVFDFHNFVLIGVPDLIIFCNLAYLRMKQVKISGPLPRLSALHLTRLRSAPVRAHWGSRRDSYILQLVHPMVEQGKLFGPLPPYPPCASQVRLS